MTVVCQLALAARKAAAFGARVGTGALGMLCTYLTVLCCLGHGVSCTSGAIGVGGRVRIQFRIRRLLSSLLCHDSLRLRNADKRLTGPLLGLVVGVSLYLTYGSKGSYARRRGLVSCGRWSCASFKRLKRLLWAEASLGWLCFPISSPARLGHDARLSPIHLKMKVNLSVCFQKHLRRTVDISRLPLYCTPYSSQTSRVTMSGFATTCRT